MITATVERSQVVYRGRFAEPAFAVLGNPAALYTNLLRHLRPFGATVDSLNINVAVLAEANVVCFLPLGHVRVRLENLEVVFRDVPGQDTIRGVLAATLTAMRDTDKSLVPVAHEGVGLLWARLGEPFSSYMRRWVTIPQGFRRAKPTLQIVELSDEGSAIGAVHLEEAAGIPEGLFIRSTFDLGSSADVQTLISVFGQKLTAQMDLLDLKLSNTLA
jgi:hypothetical protein